MATKKERKAFIQEWIKALKNGTHKQGKDVLANDLPTGKEFCCLGVACDLAVKKGILPNPRKLATNTGETTAYYYGHHHELTRGLLPVSMVEFLGFKSAAGSFNDSFGSESSPSLTALNDNGTSFKEIAKLIEKALKPANRVGLFKRGAL
jgi:hypothetical protein